LLEFGQVEAELLQMPDINQSSGQVLINPTCKTTNPSKRKVCQAGAISASLSTKMARKHTCAVPDEDGVAAAGAFVWRQHYAM
jgi:hypothetical protein